MATLQNTTINGTLTATTSFTAPKILNNTSVGYVTQEYSGTVSIPSSVNNATNYVYLFGNTNTHNRMYGFCQWTVGQSQIHNGSFYFQLSEYGLNIQTLTTTTTSYWAAERYNPSYGTNYIKFSNNIGTSWGNGNYYFVVQVHGVGTFVSDYLTQRVK